ncbi:MAG TPA: GNAT family N-acetyltransferase [Streptosporangiaceae bacterium]
MTSPGGEDAVTIRPLRTDDDYDAQMDLAERAFGVKTADERAAWHERITPLIERGAYFGAFAGERPAGAALFYDMRQWWCGRAVPMAGVSGVKIAPEDQGRGIGRRMMAALLDEIATRGFPLSALYPATVTFYRRLGWELAGGRYTAVLPARSLRSFVPPDTALGGAGGGGPLPSLRRAGPDDAAAVIDVIGRAHEAARDCGPVTFDVTTTAIRLRKPDTYAYLCDDGFVAYWWENGNDDLFIPGVRAVSAEALRSLWSVIASHATIAETVRAWTGPVDPLWWLAQEQDGKMDRPWMWMLRVVDAPAAISARGFPPAVTLDMPLIINDQIRPANSGSWMLSVADGKGRLTATAAGANVVPLALGARGLAALYAGTPLASLRLAGLAAHGDRDTDAALDAAFAADPYMLDGF